MLFSGIVYGAYRHRTLQNYEDERRQLKRQRDNAIVSAIPEQTTTAGEGCAKDDASSDDRQSTMTAENPIPVDLEKTAATLVPRRDAADELRKAVVDNPIPSETKRINLVISDLEVPINGRRNVVIENHIPADQKKTNPAVILEDPSDEHRKIVVLDVYERRVPDNGTDKRVEENDSFIVTCTTPQLIVDNLFIPSDIF